MATQNVLLPLDETLEKISSEKLILLLESESGIVRSRALATLSYRIEENIELKEVFFDSVKLPVNLTLVFFGSIKVAWIAGIAILERGDYQDKKILESCINNNWTSKEREIFCGYLKNYEGITLLENGLLHIDG